MLGYNQFAYCFNNPANMDDSAGNWPQWIKNVANWVNKNVIKPVSRTINEAKKALSTINKNIQKDIDNFDINNANEGKVLNSYYFSAYKGTITIKAPMGDNAFSYGAIFMGDDVDDVDTVKHEYGHAVQLEMLGLMKYTVFVAIPSLVGYWGDVQYNDYYSQPWEYGADLFGGVERYGYVYHDDAAEEYRIYWDKIT